MNPTGSNSPNTPSIPIQSHRLPQRPCRAGANRRAQRPRAYSSWAGLNSLHQNNKDHDGGSGCGEWERKWRVGKSQTELPSLSYNCELLGKCGDSFYSNIAASSNREKTRKKTGARNWLPFLCYELFSRRPAQYWSVSLGVKKLNRVRRFPGKCSDSRLVSKDRWDNIK